MMLRQSRTYAVAVLLVASAPVAPVLAGPLDPPAGPVAPTYKTLNEVRPGKAIRQSDIPLTITVGGEYYLAESITASPAAGNAAITINVSGTDPAKRSVRLDLNGFTLQGASDATVANWFGILAATADQNDAQRVEIRNGKISRFGTGVLARVGIEIDNVQFSNNGIGTAEGGGVLVNLGTQTSIRRSTFVRNAGWAVRLDNDTNTNQYGGSLVEDCHFTLNSNGLWCVSGVNVRNNRFDWNIFNAITLQSDNVAEGNVLRHNYDTGNVAIDVIGARNTLRSNIIENNRRGGLRIAGDNNTVESNTIVGNSSTGAANGGLQVTGAAQGNIFRSNIVKNNTSAGGTTRNYNFTSSGANQYDLLLSQLPETINVPANVTLTGSLTAPAAQNGITITADNVNIDLGGHTLLGSGASSGIVTTAPERRAISISNGTIRGFNDGIRLDASTTTSVRNVTVTGVGQRGIVANFVSTIENCRVTGVGREGIVTSDGALIRGNTVGNVGQVGGNWNAITVGQVSIVEGNLVDLVGANGIQATDGCTIRNNNVTRSTGGRGINAGSGNLIEKNNVRGNFLDGIAVISSCKVIGNNVSSNGTAAGSHGGILAFGRQNEIVENHCSFEDFGIFVTGTRNIVARNTSGEPTSGTNYNIVPGNSFGPIINVAAANNFVGVANSTHPQANFEH